MPTTTASMDFLTHPGVIGIIPADACGDPSPLLEASYRGGVRALEIPLTTPATTTPGIVEAPARPAPRFAERP